MADSNIKSIVREKYGEAARKVIELGVRTSCCDSGATAQSASCCSSGSLPGTDPITRDLYESIQTNQVPEAAVLASLGCGNPTALAELKPGETVLDLGSGGGIDVLLSARRVGPNGTAYGLDMTDEMLALALENKRRSGLTNVHFLKGEIEHIPLPANSVDVVISNCVINLSADKAQVLREAFRVLKPGGRFAVSDVVVRGEVPESIRRNMELWIGCVAGALRDVDYIAMLQAAGFEDVDIEVTRVYGADDARELLSGPSAELESLASEVDGRFVSGFVRARKPQASAKAPAETAAPAAAASGASAAAGGASACCGASRCC